MLLKKETLVVSISSATYTRGRLGRIQEVKGGRVFVAWIKDALGNPTDRNTWVSVGSVRCVESEEEWQRELINIISRH